MSFVEGQTYWYFDSITATACKLIYSRRNEQGWPIFKVTKEYEHMPSFESILPENGVRHFSFSHCQSLSSVLFYSARDCYQAQIDRLTEKMNLVH